MNCRHLHAQRRGGNGGLIDWNGVLSQTRSHCLFAFFPILFVWGICLSLVVRAFSGHCRWMDSSEATVLQVDRKINWSSADFSSLWWAETLAVYIGSSALILLFFFAYNIGNERWLVEGKGKDFSFASIANFRLRHSLPHRFPPSSVSLLPNLYDAASYNSGFSFFSYFHSIFDALKFRNCYSV